MNEPRDPDTILAAWIDEGPDRLPEPTKRAISVSTRTTHQARRSGLPRTVQPYAMVAIAAVVVVAVGAMAIAAFRPGSMAGPGSGQAVAIPLPSGSGADVPIAPGTYSIDDARFPKGITFAVPAGWSTCGVSVDEASVCTLDGSGDPEQRSIRGLSLWLASDVVADPCDPARGFRSPPVGPSVEDLVRALSDLPGFVATASTDITIDGFAGKQFRLTAPGDSSSCDLRTWSSSTRINGVGAGEVNLMRIVDVDGVRLMITGAYFPSTTSTEELAELQAVIDSVRLRP